MDAVSYDPGEWCATARGCHRVRPEDEPALQDQLLKSGMSGLMPEDELLRDPSGKVLSGALFAVPKPAKAGEIKRQRLIFDRRPQNWTERRLAWVCLPHACLFRRTQLKRGQVASGSGKDLSNFYF